MKDMISEFKGDSESPLNKPKVVTEGREYRGTKYTAYLMNREFFSLLVMRMEREKAYEWQLRFNEEFYQMENITNSCYRALGFLVQKKPKLRETMDIMQLAELQLMELRAGILLKKYMDLGRNYKDIYNSVKEDLSAFGMSKDNKKGA